MIQIFLYVHVIWSTRDREQLLKKPVRVILNAHLKKYAEDKGIHLMEVNGWLDHIHFLIQLHAAQNLSQVMRMLRSESAEWLNGTQLLQSEFDWSDEIIAYSVSPGALPQVVSFIDRQEEYHLTKTFESEIEVFVKTEK